MGCYIFTLEFLHLDKQEVSASGEVQLTDAIQKLSKTERVYAYNFEGKRYDVGGKLGFIRTNLEFALQSKEIGVEVRKMLKEELMESEKIM